MQIDPLIHLEEPMGKQRLRYLVPAILVIIALSFTACTRSASTPPPSDEGEAQDAPVDDTQATMDAVRSGILTQTAQVSEGDEGEPTATNTPIVTGTLVVATPEATLTAMGITEYTVKQGDWIWQIARSFDVDPQEIIDLNELTSPGSIQVGMVLQIPVPSVSPEATGTPGTAEAGGIVHIVKPGEWIWQIARTYGVDPQSIIDANNLVNPRMIQPGQELVIP